MCGKVNFTNLSRYSHLSERTYRRQFLRAFDFIGFNHALIREAIEPNTRQVAVIDCSFIPKSGGTTYGIDRFYNGCASRTERGLELSVLAIVDVEHSLGYTLSVQQTPSSASNKPATSDAAHSRVESYLTHLRASRVCIPKAIRYLVGDGYYSKRKWIDGVTALELEVIGKLRCDANLQHRFIGPQRRLGRRRQYGGKVTFAEPLSDFDDFGEVEPGIHLYSAIVWSVHWKRQIRIVYLRNLKQPNHPRYALLFSTDVKLAPDDLYHAYRARFQIEFIFRDAKQFTGLSDCQARDQQKLDFHFNATLSALNLAKWESYQQRDHTSPFVFSMASYKRRKLNFHLLERFIDNLELDPTAIKAHPKFSDLYDYGILIS